MGVALLMLAGSAFGIAALSGGLSAWAIVGAGTLGAGLVMVLVSLVAWYNQADREIQPVMGSNTNDTQKDESIRLAVDYFHFGKKSILNLKTGLIRDNQVFNQSINSSSQYFLSGDWDAALSSKWNLKTGIRLNFIQGDLSTYQATDQRIETYQSLRFEPVEKVRLSLNLRQLAYLDQFEPFIPSLGVDWDFWKNTSNQLSLKASLAKGIKVPTLNDRSTGEFLSIDRLILDQPKLLSLAEKAFREFHEVDENITLEESGLFFLPETGFFLPNAMGFSGDKFQLIYIPYEIGPYAMGFTELVFSLDELKGIVRF